MLTSIIRALHYILLARTRTRATSLLLSLGKTNHNEEVRSTNGEFVNEHVKVMSISRLYNYVHTLSTP